MTKKLTLGVVFGGQSSEYSVSLHSASSFLRQVNAENYDIVMIGIDPEGHFYLFDGPIDEIEHDTWKESGHTTPIAWVHEGILPLAPEAPMIKLDVVFPILHGKNGEDGAIQGLLTMLDIRYVGPDILSSAINMDKEIMHIILEQAGIPAAPYVCLREDEPLPEPTEILARFPLPWIVKPCNAGSSYGVHKVKNAGELKEAAEDAFKYDGRGKILVEKCIDGFEIGCAVMGNGGDDIFAGNVDEIEISGDVFDFDGKYEMQGSHIYCPARLPEEQREKARQLAKKAYRALDCSGMARVDMFHLPTGDLIINELNTIPGFTATSRYPTMMKEAGIPFPELIDKLVDLAMERKFGAC